jgi:hypothetical protein
VNHNTKTMFNRFIVHYGTVYLLGMSDERTFTTDVVMKGLLKSQSSVRFFLPGRYYQYVKYRFM